MEYAIQKTLVKKMISVQMDKFVLANIVFSHANQIRIVQMKVNAALEFVVRLIAERTPTVPYHSNALPLVFVNILKNVIMTTNALKK